MSYKFSLDHTLSVADIHDMITIDIKPETRSMVVNGDVAIDGYLSFRGSYLTPDLSEAPFEGYIPVDITLPYRGGVPDVSPEIVGFDYQVTNEESLTLSLEISLVGYNFDEPRFDVPVYEEAMIEPFEFVTANSEDRSHVAEVSYEEIETTPFGVVADDTLNEVRVDEVVYEEAVIEPFDFVMANSEDTPRVNELAGEEDAIMPFDFVMSSTEVVAEAIPYSPLVELYERELAATVEAVSEAPVQADESRQEELLVADFLPSLAEEPVIEDEPIRSEPRLTESAAALMDELFAMRRGTAFKDEAESLEEMVATVEAESVSEEVAPVRNNDWLGQFGDSFTTIKMISGANETAE